MTLLAHLARKIKNPTENIAVEALGYILRRKAAREALQATLRNHAPDLGEIDHVETQVVDGPTRPDLVGFDRTGKQLVQIEAKFWAGLTSKQPKAYFDRLEDGATLLFIAPLTRLEILWNELLRRMGEEGTEGSSGRGVKDKTIDGKHLMLTSWAHLLEQLLLSAEDATGRAEIEQLLGLAKRMDESRFLPFRDEDFAPEIGRRLANLNRLIVDAVARGKADGFIDTKGLRSSNAAGKMGRFILVGGAGAWFGLHLRRWASGRFPDTPLWLRFRSWSSGSIPFEDIQAALDPLIKQASPGCFRDGRNLIVPIRPLVHAEYQEVLDDVVKQLREIADRFPDRRTGS